MKTVKIRNKQTLQMTPNANSIFTICEIPIGVCISVVELCQVGLKVGMTYDGTHILGWIYIGAILQLPQTVRSDDSKKSMSTISYHHWIQILHNF